MKKINAKFIAGMLAMALVFGMAFASCEQETVTKEVLVAGPGSTTTVTIKKPVTGTPYLAYSLADIKAHIAQGREWIYVTEPVNIDEDLVIPRGTYLVVADVDYATDYPKGLGTNQSISGKPNPLPGRGSLTVKEGSSLTIADGALLVVGNTDTPSQQSLLIVEADARLYISSGATPLITTGSQIIVEKLDSGTPKANTGFFLPGGNLYVVGSLGGKSVYGQSADVNSALVVIENGAPAAIVNGQVAIAASSAALTGEGGNQFQPVPVTSLGPLATINAASPSKVVGNGGTIAFSDTDTTITYTGTGSLSANLEVGAAKALIVTGSLTTSNELKVADGGTLEVAGSLTTSGELEVKGTLEVTGSLTTSGELTVEEGAALTVAKGAKVTVANNGVVDLNALFTPAGEETTAISNGKVALEGELVVDKGGTLHVSMGDGTGVIPEIDWSKGGSLKIENGGSVTLADDTDVVYIGEDGLYEWTTGSTNEGSITIDANGITVDGDVSSLQGLNYVTSKITVGAKGILRIKGSGEELDPNAVLVVQVIDGSAAELVVEGTVELGAAGYLLVNADAKLTVTATGTIRAASGTMTVSVGTPEWVATKAKTTGSSSSNWVLVTESGETGDAATIRLGKLQLALADTGVITPSYPGTGDAAGTLTAGPGTAIVFLGASGAGS